MQRLFVAIDLPQEVINEAIKIQNLFKKENLFEGKYIEKGHFHLTLNFLGEVDDTKIEQIKDALRKIKFHHFKANLKNIGFFSLKKIKVIWIGIESQELLELQKLIYNQITDLIGLKNQNELFIAHLTIARIQSIKNVQKLKNFIQQIKLPKIEFVIDSFILKDSKLTNDGAIHNNLQIYYLE